jgi:hypothetical protein
MAGHVRYVPAVSRGYAVRARFLSVTTQLCLAQEPEADDLLTRDPLALLIGMVLDQQMQ